MNMMDSLTASSKEAGSSLPTIRPGTGSESKRKSFLGTYIICAAFVVWTWYPYNLTSFQIAPTTLPDWFPGHRKPSCQPPSFELLAHYSPGPREATLAKALEKLDGYLSKLSQSAGIDSVAFSVITPNGPVFEKGYGVLRANETEEEHRSPPNRNSIYRIASITKMFSVLETLVLRERGVLSWDDPVEKYLPEFQPPPSTYGWAEYHSGVLPKKSSRSHITLRQLAMHLSGIGRDYPPFDIGDWPSPEPLRVEKETNNFSKLMDSISRYPLINAPYSYPIYSNAGFDLLALSNVAANKLASRSPDEPSNHRELLRRDIFEPLGMNATFYRSRESSLREAIAVPRDTPEWADIDLGDIDDGAGGQYSSLEDLGKVMQGFLSPTGKSSVLPPNTIREWLHPQYAFRNTQQQVGSPWEILEFDGLQVYTKGGNLPGYHSEFVLVPEYSFGVILLVTGTNAATPTMVRETLKILRPAYNNINERLLQALYAGKWSSGTDDIAEIVMKDSALYLKQLIIRDIDILKYIQSQNVGLADKAPQPVALWPTGRVGEFRLAFGRPELNSVKDIGCTPYWITIDPGINSRDAPIDLIYWKRGALNYPSAGVQFRRPRKGE